MPFVSFSYHLAGGDEPHSPAFRAYSIQAAILSLFAGRRPPFAGLVTSRAGARDSRGVASPARDVTSAARLVSAADARGAGVGSAGTEVPICRRAPNV